MSRAPVNPNLIHRFFRDHTPAELELIRRMVGFVPGQPGDFKILWEKFKQDKITALERHDAAGHIVGICFFEINETDGHADFRVLGGFGKNEEAAYLDADFRFFEATARRLGCDSLSMASARFGLVKCVIERHGWFLGEMICRKQLEGVP